MSQQKTAPCVRNWKSQPMKFSPAMRAVQERARAEQCAQIAVNGKIGWVALGRDE